MLKRYDFISPWIEIPASCCFSLSVFVCALFVCILFCTPSMDSVNSTPGHIIGTHTHMPFLLQGHTNKHLDTAKTFICMNAHVRFGWKIQHTYSLQRIFPPWAPLLSPSLTFGACVCHVLCCLSLVTRTYSDINLSLERQFCFGSGENTMGLQTLRRQLAWHSRTAIVHNGKVCALVTSLCHSAHTLPLQTKATNVIARTRLRSEPVCNWSPPPPFYCSKVEDPEGKHQMLVVLRYVARLGHAVTKSVTKSVSTKPAHNIPYGMWCAGLVSAMTHALVSDARFALRNHDDRYTAALVSPMKCFYVSF